jgi:hypothetical protein
MPLDEDLPDFEEEDQDELPVQRPANKKKRVEEMAPHAGAKRPEWPSVMSSLQKLATGDWNWWWVQDQSVDE